MARAAAQLSPLAGFVLLLLCPCLGTAHGTAVDVLGAWDVLGDSPWQCVGHTLRAGLCRGLKDQDKLRITQGKIPPWEELEVKGCGEVMSMKKSSSAPWV